MRKTRISFLVVALVGACLMLASCAQPQVEQPVEYNKPQALESAADTVRTGKDQVTVLVLNGCGIEGAADKVAEKLEADGFTKVTTDNATYFDCTTTRVSYRTEEQRAEVDEIARLLNVTGMSSVYNYGNTKDWGREYDILVMVGDPAAVGSKEARGAMPGAKDIAS